MSRLSIIVPLDGDVPRMEATLVSVLEHRPAGSEVLVVLNGPYADPYQLSDEVRFLNAPANADWATCMNLGAREAASAILAPFKCGAEATAGWTDAALDHFQDPRVAAVAPMIVEPTGQQQIHAAGTDYTAGGRRIVRGRGRDMAAAGGISRRAISPTMCAGFYRREAFVRLGGFCPLVGEASDVDLGLRIEAAGLGVVFESASVIRAAVNPGRRAAGFRAGLCDERLFLRNLHRAGLLKSLAAHPFTLLRGLMSNLAQPGDGLLRLFGRVAAWCEWPQHAAQYHRLAQLSAAEAAPPRPLRPVQRPDGVRSDASHALLARPQMLAAASGKRK